MSSTDSNPIPNDPAPQLGSGDLAERIAAIEALLEGPPRLQARLKRLEDIVDANKLTAGTASDAPHRHMAQEEAGLLDAPLSKAILVLQNAGLRLFAILALIGAAIIYVLARALGA